MQTTSLPYGWPPRLVMKLAEAYTGRSRWTLYRAMHAGELRALCRQGKTYVFDRAELDAWMSGANAELRPTPTPKRMLRAPSTSNARERVRRIRDRGGAR